MHDSGPEIRIFMKTIQRFAQKLAAGTIALAVIGLVTQAMAQQSPVSLTASVIGKKGNARYSTDNRTWKILNVGDVLRPGAVVQTAEKSQVDLLLGVGESGGTTMVTARGAGGGAGG